MDITPLHTRLNSLQFLEKQDWQALETLFDHEENFSRGEVVFHEKRKVDHTRILKSGWAYRYKSLEDGRRQILNLLLPGDIIGFYAIMRNQSDYGVEALTPLELAVFPAARLIEVLTDAPKLTLALSWIAGQSERLLDEQITRIGQRNASERLAHLFVELFLRMRNGGFDQARSRSLPLTQSVLADVLGMSHVHANRSFRALAKIDAVSIDGRNIVINDINGLALLARFDANYLEQVSVPEATKRAIEEKHSLF